jgi:outer membrane protein assembly factor BamB
VSKQNAGWVLTADRKFNNSLLFRSGGQGQGPTIDATNRMLRVGAVFSSPLVSGGVVYFGSNDGNLYAIE